jgi:hypothetical protein
MPTAWPEPARGLQLLERRPKDPCMHKALRLFGGAPRECEGRSRSERRVVHLTRGFGVAPGEKVVRCLPRRSRCAHIWSHASRDRAGKRRESHRTPPRSPPTTLQARAFQRRQRRRRAPLRTTLPRPLRLLSQPARSPHTTNSLRREEREGSRCSLLSRLTARGSAAGRRAPTIHRRRPAAKP